MRKEGSVTVCLCLVLTIMLSLILGSLSSVQNAHARVLTACAAEQSLYSLFAQFDRDLLEEYELFFVNGGYEEGVWQPERICSMLEGAASVVLDPAAGRAVFGPAPAGGSITERYLSGITLATDQNGSPFSRQICEAMRANLGTHGIQLLFEALQEERTVVSEQERQNYEEDEVMENYEEAAAGKTGVEDGADGEEASPEGSEDADLEVQVPEDFVNPIEVIRELMQRGILSLVLPAGKEIPKGSAETEQFVSGRQLQRGFGLAVKDPGNDFVDCMLTAEYILWKFPCYTSRTGAPGLTCQAEYAIVGKDTDQANLSGVMTRLLAMREAANLLHLTMNAQKRAQIESASAVIAASMGLPLISGVVGVALALCWAFAESVVDLRELLAGGRVSLIKSASAWQISLENLPKLLETADASRKDDPGGLDYSGYLRLLLIQNSLAKLTGRAMDLVEYNMCTRCGREEFHLDYCIDELEAGFLVRFGSQEYEITRSYGYEMEV